MIHAIVSIFSYDTHTVHGAWAVIGTVILIVILLLVALRFLRPVNAEQFDEQELDALLAAHAQDPAKISAHVVDA